MRTAHLSAPDPPPLRPRHCGSGPARPAPRPGCSVRPRASASESPRGSRRSPRPAARRFAAHRDCRAVPGVCPCPPSRPQRPAVPPPAHRRHHKGPRQSKYPRAAEGGRARQHPSPASSPPCPAATRCRAVARWATACRPPVAGRSARRIFAGRAAGNTSRSPPRRTGRQGSAAPADNVCETAGAAR